jgi:hypothetical protein
VEPSVRPPADIATAQPGPGLPRMIAVVESREADIKRLAAYFESTHHWPKSVRDIAGAKIIVLYWKFIVRPRNEHFIRIDRQLLSTPTDVVPTQPGLTLPGCILPFR